jgi:Zn finger protein HypA/HybF involved in hydrogenase expression
MTALKINRFSLSEIKNVTIRCKTCGIGGSLVSLDSERFGGTKCPSCGAPFGELANNAFEALQSASGAVRLGSEHFDIEFDIEED